MTTFFEFVWECFEDLTLRILVVAAIISIIVGIIETIQTGEQAWIEGLAIIFAICLVVLVTSINNYVKELKFRKLNEEAQERNITVLREGKESTISVFDLVVGDIAKVGNGDVMPVDALILWSMKLLVDESTVTGEPDLIKKGLGEGEGAFLLSGSQIADGTGRVLVLTVGNHTFLGKNLEKILNVEETETPLQMKLNYIAEFIGKIGLAMALLTFFVLLIYAIVAQLDDTWNTSEFIKAVVDGFIVGVTIVVVAVPEGLPLAVTLSLAFSVEQMKKKNNLVRHLDASETMGQATNICSDKTGTLTQNIMKVVSIAIGEEIFEHTEKKDFNSELVKILGQHFCRNTTASVGINASGLRTFTGSRTEIALLDLAKEWGFEYEKIRNLNDIVVQIPFNSKIKRMETVVKVDDKVYAFVKGASEVVLELCTKYIDKHGNVHDLHEDTKKKIYEEIIINYANRAYRTLGLAYKVASDSQYFVDENGEPNTAAIEEDLILAGIVGIQDPVRPGVPEAVRTCQRAGITVRMVTGDNRDTAVAIARNCDIIPKDYKYTPGDDVVLLGEEFRNRVQGLVDAPDGKDKIVGNLEELKKIVSHMRVLARSSPEDKFILVTGLKQLNEVVAVTGDGSNDAPALKKSNVGFAMHIAGTQLAQEASDIILLDDNFASIVTAVLWGRNIYDSISKFIQFQLTVNIVALAMSFIGAVVLKQSPITAVQMLWVNLIMDTFAALALATEPPVDSLLLRQPVKHDDSLLTIDMVKTITGQVIYQLSWLLFILFAIEYIPLFDGIYIPAESKTTNGVEKVENYPYTLFFQTFVMMQVFNQINCRKLKSSELNVFAGFFNNWLFLFIITFTVIVQLLIVQFGGVWFETQALSLSQHLFCVGVGVGALIFGILFRLVPTRWFTFFHFKEEAKPAGGFTEIVRRKTITTRRASRKP